MSDGELPEPAHTPLDLTPYELAQFFDVHLKGNSEQAVAYSLFETILDGTELEEIANRLGIKTDSLRRQHDRFSARMAALWAAAAVLLLFLGWKTRRLFLPEDHPPITQEQFTDRDRAIALRDRGLELCARGSYDTCRETIDQAIALSPAIGSEPRVVKALEEATPAPDAAVDPMADDVRRFVRDWSAAIDHHDLRALERLYADDVAYEGSWEEHVPRARVLADKRALLGPGSTFHQSLEDPIDVTPGEIQASRAVRVRLISGTGGSLRVVTEILEVEKSFLLGRLVITKETDEGTIKARAAWRSACEGAADAAVRAVPEVKAFLDRAATETAPSADGTGKPSLYTAPTSDLDGERFSVVIGYATEIRLLPSPRVEYTASRATGRIDLRVNAKPVAVPGSSVSEVVDACKTP
jgi:hypothetical protein